MKRKILTVIAAYALIIIMSSFAGVSYRGKKTPEEFWKQLGITELEAKGYFKMCLLNESGFFRTRR